MKLVVVYKRFERFWHWTQSILILFLALTGFEIHGSLTFFGFDEAIRLHSIAATGLLILIAFAIFWHATSGEWRQYLPTRRYLRAQAEFYLIGIFRNAPHPTRKTTLSKLNPLQRIVYFMLKILVIPVMVVSGLLLMFYRYPQSHGIGALTIKDLAGIAISHTIGAYLLVTFVIIHIYLITTGRTPASNLRAMLTGVEELEAGEEAHDGGSSLTSLPEKP